MRKVFPILLILLFNSNIMAQDTTMVLPSKLPAAGILLDKGWKFLASDDPAYALPQYNDTDWQPIDPTQDIRALPQLWKTNIGWFRLHLTVDNRLAKESIEFLVSQTGASEIFLNGQLISRFGKIKPNPKQVQAVATANGSFIPFPVSRPGVQVLAVRFAVQKGIPYINFAGSTSNAFALQAIGMQQISNNVGRDYSVYFEFMRVGLFLILAVLHLALFRFNPSQKANLYFFIYALFLTTSETLLGLLSRQSQLVATTMFFYIAGLLFQFTGTLFFVLAVYKTFHYRIKLIFWLIMAAPFLAMLSFGFYNPYSLFTSIVFVLPPSLEVVRVSLLATKARQRGASIVIAGALSFSVIFIFDFLFVLGYIPAGPNWIWGHLVFFIGWISLPVSISIYLALESSYTSRTLTEKLVEVQQLSKEKQQLLATENERLEQQVEQRTHELTKSLQDLKVTQKQLIQSEKMASLGELTAGIAHEIQNPLNFVNNFSETNTELIHEAKTEFKAGNNDEGFTILEDIQENEQKINHHGRRADAIVKGMLEHSRSSKGEKLASDLNKLVDEYFRLAYHGMRAKDKNFNVRIETHFDESLGKINVVPQEIGRVLLNLFNNAFYTVLEKKKQVGENYEPTVAVSTKQLNDKIEISVQDNGMGIPRKIVDKIFQPFFTTKPTGEGTGLGLSLSYDIVKAHGGELKVASSEDAGAEFTIVLPINTHP